jgi:hypothetical protein
MEEESKRCEECPKGPKRGMSQRCSYCPVSECLPSSIYMEKCTISQYKKTIEIYGDDIVRIGKLIFDEDINYLKQ